MNLILSGKCALATGGNAGPGAAIAVSFVAEPARVAGNGVARPGDARRPAAEWPAAGTRMLALEADVTDPAARHATATRANAGGRMTQCPRPITDAEA